MEILAYNSFMDYSFYLLALQVLFGCHQINFRSSTAQIIASLNGAYLICGLGIKYGNVALQSGHCNLQVKKF